MKDKIIMEAKKCWDEFQSYDKMISCLKQKGFKDADIKLTELSLEDIGYILGITRERIRQIEANAKKKIKHFALYDKNFREIIKTLWE